MLDAFISGLISGNAYALIAIGISLIFGVADLINLAHASILGFGAMLGWWMVTVLHWSLWETLAGVAAITALMGFLVEFLCVRPLLNAPPIAALLTTLAVSLVLDSLSQLIFSPEIRLLPSLLQTNNFKIGDLRFGTLDLAIMGVSLLSVTSLWLFLKFSNLGRAIRATAQDREAAQQMGVSVKSIMGLSFGIASALAGIGGVLVGMYYGNVYPYIGSEIGIAGFTAATLGGLGSLPGAVVGGLVLGIAQSFSMTIFGGIVRDFVTFAILIGVLWLKPGGLFGSSRIIFREPMTGTFFKNTGKVLNFKGWQLALSGFLVIVVLPIVGDNYIMQIATIVVIFAVLALSLTLVAGTAGQVSLGQAGSFAIGAYASALLTKQQGWSFWLALPAAAIIAAIFTTIFVSPGLRLKGHYVAIATMGIGAITGAILLNFEWLTRGPLGINNIPVPDFFGNSIEAPRDYYFLSLAVLLICVALVLTLQRSHLGRGWRAIREDEVAARSMGVPVASYKALVFAVGGLVAGAGGSLLAHQYTFLSPDIFNAALSTLAITIVVLGGMANPWGAIVGAIVLVGAPELFRPLQDVRQLGYGLLLLLLMRFRPQGLWGSR